MTNMENIKLLRSKIPLEVFEEHDFHLACRHLSRVAQHSLLSRLLKKGDLRKVSRGLYVFDEIWRRKPLSKIIIANHLVAPSYVSFESALSHHGLIPEAVYVTTSASLKREKKSFKTPFGDFTYHHVPQRSFALEIESVATPAGHELIASPIKALFDLVYAYRRTYGSLSDLESDLRIEPTEIIHHAKELSVVGLEELALSYKKQTCLTLYQVLKKELR
jgi:hypothetical protein